MSGRLSRALGGGFILREATAADTDALAAFNAAVHADTDDEELTEESLTIWTRELMEGAHPTMRPEDTLLVMNGDGEIVSSLDVIPQHWAYAGIPFPVGRIELVGTHPDYRRRGLVRELMDDAHHRSAAAGHLVQGITGIPDYYRRFGYEMALPLGDGRTGVVTATPKVDDLGGYSVRAATAEDVSFIAATQAFGRGRYVVADAWSEEEWRWHVAGRDPKCLVHTETAVVLGSDGEPVGYVLHADSLRRHRISVYMLDLAEGVPWPDAVPAILEHLKATGERLGAAADPPHTFSEFYFALGSDHPVYEVLPKLLDHRTGTYGWYVRVPDVVAFLAHVAPALEWRLADSAMAGASGNLDLNLGGVGVRIKLEQGFVAGIEPWDAKDFGSGDAVFPGLTFLSVLFGFQPVEEVERTVPDAYTASDRGRALVEALFPAGPSLVHGMG